MQENNSSKSFVQIVKNSAFNIFKAWVSFSLVTSGSVGVAATDSIIRRTKENPSTSSKEILKEICGSPQFDMGNKAKEVTFAFDKKRNQVITQGCQQSADSEECLKEQAFEKQHKSKLGSKSRSMINLRRSVEASKNRFQTELANKFNKLSTDDKLSLQEFASELISYHEYASGNEHARKNGIGNCGEHTSSAIIDFTKQKLKDPDLRIQMIKLTEIPESPNVAPDDHSFVLVNSNIYDVNTAEQNAKHNVNDVLYILKRGSTFLCDRWNNYAGEFKKDRTGGFYSHQWQHAYVRTMRLVEVFKEKYSTSSSQIREFMSYYMRKLDLGAFVDQEEQNLAQTSNQQQRVEL